MKSKMISSGKPKQNRLRVVERSPSEDTPTVNPDPDLPRVATSAGACPHCFGTGMEVVPEVGARRCRCQTSDHLERLFQEARIPARYQHCDLKNFEASLENAQDISKMKAKGEAILI